MRFKCDNIDCGEYFGEDNMIPGEVRAVDDYDPPMCPECGDIDFDETYDDLDEEEAT